MYQNKKGNQTKILRLEKEKRKKKKRKQRNIRIGILVVFGMTIVAIAVHIAGIDLAANSAYVMKASTGEVLFEKNSTDAIAPASTTKLITALTAMRYCDMDDIVTIGKEVKMIASDSSKAGLLPGEKMSVKQLMIAMLLPSGNDAAYALAAHTGRVIAKDNSMGYKKAVAVFVKEMNETAKEVSADHSKFCSPDGYDCNGQEVTAEDIAEIGKAVVASKELTSITCMKESHEIWKTGETGDYKNTNLLLDENSEYYNRDTIGLKTGTSDAAGCCLVSAFEISGEDYIVVVMGSTEEGRWEDANKLYKGIVNGDLL